GGPQQRGATGRVAVAHNLDPAALFQGAHNLSGDRDAANVFDVAARHGLTPGNDGQGLEYRPRIPGWTNRIQTTQITLHFGATLETPARSDADQFEPPVLPIELQQRQHAPQIVRSDLFRREELA